MKERSLVERIVAILGVLVGTVAWVGRLLFSMVKGLLSGGSQPDEDEATGDRSAMTDTAKTYASDLREKGESLMDTARERGLHLVEDAREKVDDLANRGDEGEEGDGRDAMSSESSGVSSSQHDDIGGVPETGLVAAANLSAMDSAYDEQAASTMDDDRDSGDDVTAAEGIPNLEEPGTDGDVDLYGSESGSLMGRNEEMGYAGQPMSESDIGIDRGDSISGFADSGDRSGAASRGWVSDEVNLDQEEESAEYEPDEDEDAVPAASRGWQEPEDDVLKDDPLYGDFESSGSGGEIDLRNDEANEADAAGMHIVESPDEPFIEDEDASMSEGFVAEGTEPPFDTTTGEEIDVDEIGAEPVSIGEDQLAADALGNPAGGDAASGDVGPDESSDDTTRPPGESRPDYDVPGARAGSGVDEFADDAVAESMIDDVTSGAGTGTGGDDETSTGDDAGESTSAAGSIAWASSAGVVDRDLAKPLSAEELQSGSDASVDDVEAGEAGVTEADADLKDVAADVVQDLGEEMDARSVPSGTTMSGAGQSAGAMTSDDAATGDDAGETMTRDTGTPETGGVPATEPEEGGGEASGDAITEASTGGRSFDEVLPERQYASEVGYETLKVDDMGSTGTDAFRGSFLTETSTSGESAAITGTSGNQKRGSGGSAPEGSVRGDGGNVCPPGYPIKGNANSKIYHRPTDTSYENTKPEFCFATEEDAKAAGFRPRKG